MRVSLGEGEVADQEEEGTCFVLSGCNTLELTYFFLMNNRQGFSICILVLIT